MIPAIVSIILAIAGTAITTVQASQQAKSVRAANKASEKAVSADAAAARGAAAGRASRAVSESSRRVSAQRAAAAATGFDVNRGDIVDIQAETARRGQEDADQLLLTGQRASEIERVQLSNLSASTQSAQNLRSGTIAGSVISGAGQVSSAWYRFGLPTTGA